MSQSIARRLRAQDGLCAYCRKPIAYLTDDPNQLATWDEIVPMSKGGRKVSANRVVACLPCNQRKANRHVHEFMPGWEPDWHWSLVDGY